MYTRKLEYCSWKFCWGPYDYGEPSEGPQYSLNSIDLKTCRGIEKIFMSIVFYVHYGYVYLCLLDQRDDDRQCESSHVF